MCNFIVTINHSFLTILINVPRIIPYEQWNYPNIEFRNLRIERFFLPLSKKLDYVMLYTTKKNIRLRRPMPRMAGLKCEAG